MSDGVSIINKGIRVSEINPLPVTIANETTGGKVEVGPRVQTPSGNVMQVQIGPGDIISEIPVVLQYDHHQIHEGETWGWEVFVNSLASGLSKDIQLVVPIITVPVGANPVELCPHFRFEVISDSPTDIFLYETPTISVDGTQRTPINFERNGSYTSKLIVREDPTVTGVGTEIFRGVTFTTKTSAGSAESSINERVFKNNTAYLFRVTSGAAGAKVMIRLMWYEDLGV